MAIGDVNSTERGSGARELNNKAPLELLPLGETARFLTMFTQTKEPFLYDKKQMFPLTALSHLASFQEGNNNAIYYAMAAMGDEFESLEECAYVLDYGRKKYAEWNWVKGMPWSVVIGCAARHITAILKGELIDPVEKGGSGLSHRGHVMCNLMFLATYLRVYPEGDDRPVKWLNREPISKEA